MARKSSKPSVPKVPANLFSSPFSVPMSKPASMKTTSRAAKLALVKSRSPKSSPTRNTLKTNILPSVRPQLFGKPGKIRPSKVDYSADNAGDIANILGLV